MNPKHEPHAGTVLVVDDVPDTLRMLCDALMQEGYTVLVARDGEQALERLAAIQPDAILMDAVMPGLSGFETCQRIKAHAVWSAIPVIFMTGLSDTADVVAGFDAGGVDYVVKPVRIEEVLARLSTHVRNARTAREAWQRASEAAAQPSLAEAAVLSRLEGAMRVALRLVQAAEPASSARLRAANAGAESHLDGRSRWTCLCPIAKYPRIQRHPSGAQRSADRRAGHSL